MTTRKLSKTMRKLNLIQKVVMGILAGISLMLATLTDTSEIYYQFVSVFSSAFPIVWSQILDACKDYESEQTPSPSPTTLSPASPSAVRALSETNNTPTSTSPVGGRSMNAPSPHPSDLNDAPENSV